jgi:diguanylate cyclase (GGDEF)-like protein/PAS domain S-box-containing protein
MPSDSKHYPSTPPVAKTKFLLIAGFSASLLILVILAAVGLSSMYNNLSRINQIVETNNVKISLLREMHNAARERSLLLHMMLDTRDPFTRDELFLEFIKHGTNFANARIAFGNMKLNRAEQELLVEQGRASGIAVPIQREIVDLIQQEKYGTALDKLFNEAVPLQDKVLVLLNALQDLQQKASEQTASQSKHDLQSLITQTFFLVAFGTLIGVFIASIVTRRITRTETQLQVEKRLAEVTLHSVGEAVITTDIHGNISYINPVAEAMTGWTLERARYRPLLDVWKISQDGNKPTPDNPILTAISEDSIISSANNVNLTGAAGDVFAVEHTAAPIRDDSGQVHGGILIFRDVTEVRSLASQLSYQASHDSLTGLVNRREFEIRLQQALENARVEHQQYALCYLDLDQFKVINDTCGHAAGDELLKQVSNELKSFLRDSDTLSRLGGDEFGVLLEGCSIEKAKEIAEKLRATLKLLRFAWDDKQFEVGVSIGLVPITPISGSLADLLSAADSACYEAKDQGRNRVHLFDPHDINILRRQGEMHWVHRITDALENRNLILYCQAIAPLKPDSKAPKRYEILVRMQEENGKVIPPSAFLPAAERYNLMTMIDRYVVESAIRLLQQIKRQNREIHLSVNLSGQSLNEDAFHHFLISVLNKYDIEPSWLTLEITETATVANFSKASRLITAIKALGCLFALDDFGSGLSSFSYLKNIPVDFIKIDGSFVRDIVSDETDFAFVRSITQIASIMGLKTIAEYVENERIVAKLEEIGVDYIQGHFIGKAIPIEQAIHLQGQDELDISVEA